MLPRRRAFRLRGRAALLVGYRATPGIMSSDLLQMFRSTELVLDEYQPKYPEHAAGIAQHLQASRHWFAYRAAAMRRRDDAASCWPKRCTSTRWPRPGTSRARLSIAPRPPAAALVGRKPFPLYTEVVW